MFSCKFLRTPFLRNISGRMLLYLNKLQDVSQKRESKVWRTWHQRINFLHVYFCIEVKLINSSLKIEAFSSHWNLRFRNYDYLTIRCHFLKLKVKLFGHTWKTWFEKHFKVIIKFKEKFTLKGQIKHLKNQRILGIFKGKKWNQSKSY